MAGGRPRSRTLQPRKHLTRKAMAAEAIGVDERAELEARRPRTRGDCAAGVRPCPWVGCKHHLYLDVNPRTGSLKLNLPELEPWELVDTCSLDVADHGGATLETVGGHMNLTRERVRQVELTALHELRARVRALLALD